MLLAILILYLSLGTLIAVLIDAREDMFIATIILYPIVFLIFAMYMFVEIIRYIYSGFSDLIKRLL
jgi:hypothetical protein